MNNAPIEELRTILSKAKMPCSEEMVQRLWFGDDQGVDGLQGLSGLQRLFHEFRVMRIAKTAPTAKARVETYERLKGLARDLAQILDHDLGTYCTLESELGAFGANTAQIADLLHRLQDAAEQVKEAIYRYSLTKIAAQAQEPPREIPQRPRDENAETWLFVELYRLYCVLSGKNAIGTGGPLYRFISESVKLLGQREIVMPTQESFRNRLKGALQRGP